MSSRPIISLGIVLSIREPPYPAVLPSPSPLVGPPAIPALWRCTCTQNVDQLHGHCRACGGWAR